MYMGKVIFIEKRKLLFDAVINVIINELYPEYLSKQVVELFVERFNLENIVIPDYDYFEDDDINESIKFKIGNKILTEHQLRKLINYLL